MNPERLMIEILIASHSVDPYCAKVITQTWLKGSISLDQPIKANSKSTLSDFIPNNAPSPEDIAIEKDQAVRIRELINNSNLTTMQKLVFDLRFEGWRPTEIADMLGFKKCAHITNLFRSAKQKILRNPDLPKILGLKAS